jgi:hypothetical protein
MLAQAGISAPDWVASSDLGPAATPYRDGIGQGLDSPAYRAVRPPFKLSHIDPNPDDGQLPVSHGLEGAMAAW